MNQAAKNFKWPKNREDGSDLADFWTESIAATRSIIFWNFRAPLLPKTSKNFRKTTRTLSVPVRRVFGDTVTGMRICLQTRDVQRMRSFFWMSRLLDMSNTVSLKLSPQNRQNVRLLRLVDGRLRAHRPNASFSSKNFRTNIFCRKKVSTTIFRRHFFERKISGARSAWLMIREHPKETKQTKKNKRSSSMTTMDLLRWRRWTK